MTDEEIIQLLRARVLKLKFMRYLNGDIHAVNQAKQEAILAFHPGEDLCQTAGVIQGGFVTAMLDGAMAHAVLVASKMTLAPPTLELKVSFLRAALPGPHKAVGRVLRMGKSIGFLEGELFNAKGEVIAKSSATAMLVPQEPVKPQA
ncbi:MAG: PaaI family thioesterase [Pseudomonadota bacterium]